MAQLLWARAQGWSARALTCKPNCWDAVLGQFEQLMDPNVLARFVVPRPLNNFLDNLPSEERLAADGPWTLVEPTSKLLKEVGVASCACARLALTGRCACACLASPPRSRSMRGQGTARRLERSTTGLMSGCCDRRGYSSRQLTATAGGNL